MFDRRSAIFGSFSAFCTYALLHEARAAVGTDSRLSPRRWLLRQDELARGLKNGTLTQIAWHDEVNALAREVDVSAIAAEIRRARLVSAGTPFGHDPRKRLVRFIGEDGQPARLSYGTALFDFGEGNVITPHAHKHMASAHMVIDGKVRIRTFDRVGDSENALLIRPTSDHTAEEGEAAAMTTARDNIHWFAPRSPRAMTFDVIVDGLDAGKERYVIQPVDPLGGTWLDSHTLRAPLLTFGESSRRYASTT